MPLLNIQKYLEFFSISPHHIRFRRIISKSKPRKYRGKETLLIENRPYLIDLAGLQYFLPVAMGYYKANCVVYDMKISDKKFFLKDTLKFKFSLLASISKAKYINFTANKSIAIQHKVIVEELMSGKYSKYGFQNFVYKDVLIGDLIYDIYLRKTSSLTLEFNDALRFHISTILQYFDKISDYFEHHRVKAVVVSHPVYHFAIAARIALKYGADAFLVDATYLTKFTVSNPYPYVNNFTGLKNHFDSLQTTQKTLARELGQQRLIARLDGDYSDLKYVAPDMKEVGDFKLQLNSKNTTNLLVALHDFNDSPHRYGNNLYPDFYEWLLDLCELTKKSNVNLLLKPHPWALRNIDIELSRLSKNYDHVVLIPANLRTKNLAKLGIKFVTTMHGHIAHEAPALGLTVINACIHNPHFEYDFSVTPRDLKEYRQIISNIEKFNFKFDMNSLYDYYFEKYIQNFTSWSIPKYSDFLNSMGKIRNFDNLETLSWLLNPENKINMTCRTCAVRNFIISKDLYIQKKHFLDSRSEHGDYCDCSALYKLKL